MQKEVITSHLPVYIFNVLHIGSTIGLSFKVVNDYMRNTSFLEYDMVFLLMALINMASGTYSSLSSGYMMTFLLRPERMGENKNMWISFHHFKLLGTLILFLPIYKFLPILSSGIVTARFIWLVVLVFLSPIAKYYREHYAKQIEYKKE